jgi:hypothetical protein
MDSTDINSLLVKWENIKKELTYLNQTEQAIKEQLNDYMDAHKKTRIETSHFLLKRDLRVREQVSKSHLPREVWDKYKQPTEYSVLSLKRK